MDALEENEFDLETSEEMEPFVEEQDDENLPTLPFDLTSQRANAADDIRAVYDNSVRDLYRWSDPGYLNRMERNDEDRILAGDRECLVERDTVSLLAKTSSKIVDSGDNNYCYSALIHSLQLGKPHHSLFGAPEIFGNEVFENPMGDTKFKSKHPLLRSDADSYLIQRIDLFYYSRRVYSPLKTAVHTILPTYVLPRDPNIRYPISYRPSPTRMQMQTSLVNVDLISTGLRDDIYIASSERFKLLKKQIDVKYPKSKLSDADLRGLILTVNTLNRNGFLVVFQSPSFKNTVLRDWDQLFLKCTSFTLGQGLGKEYHNDILLFYDDTMLSRCMNPKDPDTRVISQTDYLDFLHHCHGYGCCGCVKQDCHIEAYFHPSPCRFWNIGKVLGLNPRLAKIYGIDSMCDSSPNMAQLDLFPFFTDARMLLNVVFYYFTRENPSPLPTNIRLRDGVITLL